uniref:hypothetical protein n=1 Tax=Acetatifactor sp. TaxID=1872090 RepID=UPI0040566BD2
MDTKINDFLEAIRDADMVLVGLGEEFNQLKLLKEIPEYIIAKEQLDATGKEWLIPALNTYFSGRQDKLYQVLGKFAEVLAEKNYFVVSVSTNDVIKNIMWREKRLVMPCGGTWMKQCVANCGQKLEEVNATDQDVLQEYIKNISASIVSDNSVPDLGYCPKCGKPLVLNSIYTQNYDENGYLEQWQLYTKWLQGTLNRKLVVVELGVGMQCPSVIRWPFEKVAFFNQKASFWRINEKLYQLSEELSGKGTSISMNAIDWLGLLC